MKKGFIPSLLLRLSGICAKVVVANRGAKIIVTREERMDGWDLSLDFTI